jgi:hypothetical protein
MWVKKQENKEEENKACPCVRPLIFSKIKKI